MQLLVSLPNSVLLTAGRKSVFHATNPDSTEMLDRREKSCLLLLGQFS